MTGAVVTGTALVTPFGSAAATAAALRAGEALLPDPGTGAVPLTARDVDTALAALTAGLPHARPGSWRGAGTGVRAGLVAALRAAAEATLLDPGGSGGGVAPDRVALVLAGHNLGAEAGERFAATYRATPQYVPPSAAVRMWDSDAVGLVSALTGIRGESAVVGGASASGLVALVQAERILACGAADACLVVAPALQLTPWQVQALRAAGAMRGGDAEGNDPGRPFDASADGFVPSAIAAAVVLERPGSAAARAARPLARHLGGATVLGGTSGPEPDADAEERVIRLALDRAELSAAAVDHVAAHATGSRRGDACELAALGRVFGGTAGPGPLVSAPKGLLGHGLTSAGLAQYVLTVQQLRVGRLHPMPWLRDPVPHPGVRLCPAGGPARLRTALTTSYGFGGIHAAAVLAAERDR